MAPTETHVRASETLFRYCKAIDRHDAIALADVFTEDVVLAAGPPGVEQEFAGRNTVVTILASLFEQRQWARHLMANVLVEVGGDGDVHVEAYGHYTLGTDAGTNSGLADYQVTLRDTDGQLLIARLHVTIVHQTTGPGA